MSSRLRVSNYTYQSSLDLCVIPHGVSPWSLYLLVGVKRNFLSFVDITTYSQIDLIRHVVSLDDFLTDLTFFRVGKYMGSSVLSNE